VSLVLAVNAVELESAALFAVDGDAELAAVGDAATALDGPRSSEAKAGRAEIATIRAQVITNFTRAPYLRLYCRQGFPERKL
jgi:hypothetical protein